MTVRGDRLLAIAVQISKFDSGLWSCKTGGHGPARPHSTQLAREIKHPNQVSQPEIRLTSIHNLWLFQLNILLMRFLHEFVMVHSLSLRLYQL